MRSTAAEPFRFCFNGSRANPSGFLFRKGIVPAKVGEAGKITIGGTEGQPMLNSQRRQVSIGHEVRARQYIAQ